MTHAYPSDGLTLARAYAACRAIARREAKNFYYAFIALPAPRRNAICAIYAFMRKADDMADDESLSLDVRRRSLEAWLSEWRAVCRRGGDFGPDSGSDAHPGSDGFVVGESNHQPERLARTHRDARAHTVRRILKFDRGHEVADGPGRAVYGPG